MIDVTNSDNQLKAVAEKLLEELTKRGISANPISEDRIEFTGLSDENYQQLNSLPAKIGVLAGKLKANNVTIDLGYTPGVHTFPSQEL